MGGRRDPVRVLSVLEGRATWEQLRALSSRHAVREAVARGDVVRGGRGLYRLAELSEPRAAAAAVGGVLSHLSAAGEIGLSVLRPPGEVHVIVPKASHRAAPPGVVLHRIDLPRGDATRTSTRVLRTVLDCAVALPFADALAVADSALHQGLVGRPDLAELARERRGPGALRVRRVVEHAHDDATNAFESAMRAAVIEAGVTGFVPQLVIALPGYRSVQVDLGDPRRRIVIEADSYAHHAGRAEFRADCRRYNELVRAGWLVLRVTWEDALFAPEAVGRLVVDACALRDREGDRGGPC